VLKGKKDLEAGAAPSVLALQGRIAEQECSFKRELLRVMEEGNAHETDHFSTVEALQG
jgi:hypothetical protein